MKGKIWRIFLKFVQEMFTKIHDMTRNKYLIIKDLGAIIFMDINTLFNHKKFETILRFIGYLCEWQ